MSETWLKGHQGFRLVESGVIYTVSLLLLDIWRQIVPMIQMHDKFDIVESLSDDL